MLRRRLDLQYPNQKAIVYVADATTDKPDWQEAGTWYTAGGNTVVFGDPRVIPDAKRKQHVELAPPAHVVQTSNRRWRDDEFLLPTRLTRGVTRFACDASSCRLTSRCFRGIRCRKKLGPSFDIGLIALSCQGSAAAKVRTLIYANLR